MMAIDAFIQAAGKGNIKELKRLISLNPSKIENMLSANDFAAFRLAAQNGHLDVMKYLAGLAGCQWPLLLIHFRSLILIHFK